MGREEQIINERKRKIAELRKQGINPYVYKFDKTQSCAECVKSKTGGKVKTAGRLMTYRDLGKIAFGNLRDMGGDVQIVLQEGKTPEKIREFAKKYVDTGDFVGVEGKIIKTKTGQISVLVNKLELLTKSILPLPDKWHGLQDKEERYRKRYLDLVMNPEVRGVFEKRQQIINAIREYLVKENYVEVQTPILQPIYGGTNAKPFDSKLNALDMKVYMRISNEMYLKRLIGGGYEKVFEFSPDFRNEGIDKLHNPEFTQVETMWAYADYKDNMKLWEKVIEFIVKRVHGKTRIEIGGNKIDFKIPWAKVKFLDAIKKYAKIDFTKFKSLEEAKKAAEKIGIDTQGVLDIGKLMIEVFEAKVQPNIIQPSMIYDYPQEAAILSRAENGIAKSFEVIINGWEIALSYCEENDPAALRAKWEQQEKALKRGDEEAQKMDEDFLNMLQQGMPPTSGLGMGIDRLVMLLTNQASIRDVILFPFMKPEKEGK